MSNWILDVREQEFESSVIERSRTIPVVVDFWAPWCGPCRALGPLLEKLAVEHNGEFILAKVNVDQNPNIAAAFGARSIPMVLGFRDGKVVTEFVGAVPEAAVREFLKRLLPSDAERIAAKAGVLLAEGKAKQAEAAYRQAIEKDPRCAPALIGLARVLARREEANEALELLGRVSADGHLRAEADRLAAEIRVRQAGGADEPMLRARLAANPADLEARFALGQSAAAAGRYAEALQEYFEIVQRDRSFKDDAARKAMLDIFELLGSAHELTERYRSELAKVLFR